MDKTDYFTVEVYGGQARACAQYLRKGSRVVVDTELDWREWTDQQGNKREALTFRARQVLFEGSRPERASNGDDPDAGPTDPFPAPPSVPAPTVPTTTAASDAEPVGSDDLPF